MFNNHLSLRVMESEPWFLGFPFHCVSTPTMANFKLPKWCRWIQSWKEKHTISPCEPVQAGSATPLRETSWNLSFSCSNLDLSFSRPPVTSPLLYFPVCFSSSNSFNVYTALDYPFILMEHPLVTDCERVYRRLTDFHFCLHLHLQGGSSENVFLYPYISLVIFLNIEL